MGQKKEKQAKKRREDKSDDMESGLDVPLLG
jgi:hypothetical protein